MLRSGAAIKRQISWLPTVGAFLLLIGASNAADTTVASIIANPTQFNGTLVTVRGTVGALRETTSHAGNDYSTFQVRDRAGGAIKVFVWGHPHLMNGNAVKVIGRFEQVERVGRYAFYNEIEAKSVRTFAH